MGNFMSDDGRGVRHCLSEKLMQELRASVRCFARAFVLLS